jgi:hypothetical protein
MFSILVPLSRGMLLRRAIPCSSLVLMGGCAATNGARLESEDRRAFRERCWAATVWFLVRIPWHRSFRQVNGYACPLFRTRVFRRMQILKVIGPWFANTRLRLYLAFALEFWIEAPHSHLMKICLGGLGICRAAACDPICLLR